MSADLIARLVLLFASGVVFYGEYLFMRYGIPASATVEDKVRFVHEDTSDFLQQDIESRTSFRLGITLDDPMTDGRKGRITLPRAEWLNVERGKAITVMALPHRDSWMVWSFMTRPESALHRRPVRVYLAGLLTLGCLVFAGAKLV